MRKTVFASLALVLSTLPLAACGEKEAPPADSVDGKPGVEITNGRIVLPAVAGNPAALYLDIVNNSDGYAVVRKAEVPGAKDVAMHESVTTNGKAEMVDLAPVNLVKGQSVKFEPGGKHFMIMGLDPAPAAGETKEVTLTFAGGDKSTFTAKVEAPGGGN